MDLLLLRILKKFDKIGINYIIVSIIISCISLLFSFFLNEIVFFGWNIYNRIISFAQSFMFGFLLIGIQYIINYINYNSYKKNKLNSFYIDIKMRFDKRAHRHLIIGIIWSIFILRHTIGIASGELPIFYFISRTSWTLVFDIYNYATEYIKLYLIAIVLWLSYETTFCIIELSKKPNIKIDLCSPDKMGGFRQMMEFFLKILIIFFIGTTLAIISEVNPFTIFDFENFFFISLMFIGVFFFYTGMDTISRFIKGKIENEINKINEKYKIEYQKLLNFESMGRYKDENDNLNLISTKLNALYTEKEKLMQLYNERISFMAVIKFIGSFILVLVTLINKLYQNQFLVAMLQKLIELRSTYNIH